MWQSHLDQLIQIVVTKADLEGKDTHPSAIWFLLVVDTYAALATGGKGDLVDVLEEMHLIPDASLLVPYTLTRGRDGISEFERDSLISATKAHQQVVLLAAKLAKLSRNFDYIDESRGSPLDQQEVSNRQEQIQQILAEMRDLLRYQIFDSLVALDCCDKSSSRMHSIYYQVFPHFLASISQWLTRKYRPMLYYMPV